MTNKHVKKKISIINYLENAKNHHIPSIMTKVLKLAISNIDKDVKQLIHSYTARNAKWPSHLGKVCQFLVKLNRHHLTPRFQFWRLTQEKLKCIFT